MQDLYCVLLPNNSNICTCTAVAGKATHALSQIEPNFIATWTCFSLNLASPLNHVQNST